MRMGLSSKDTLAVQKKIIKKAETSQNSEAQWFLLM